MVKYLTAEAGELTIVKVKFGQRAGDYYEIQFYNKEIELFPLNEAVKICIIAGKKEQKGVKIEKQITKEQEA